MIAIIPCAGKGTRRRPETTHTPKILLEYAEQPLIEHIVRPIDGSGRFEKIVLVLSLKHGQQVIDYVRRHPFETAVKFVWQQEPLGFGHAVLQAREEVFSPIYRGRLFRKWNPPVLIHTDDAVNTHRNPEKDLIEDITAQSVSQIGVQWRGNVRNYGMVITRRDESGKVGKGESEQNNSETDRSCSPSHSLTCSPAPLVERLVEKPYWDEGGLAITGIYFIRESRRLFHCLDRLVQAGRCLGGEYQFTHALQMMISDGTTFKTLYHNWTDCGKTK